MELALKKLQGSYTILKLETVPSLTKDVIASEFFALIISPEEITLICAERFAEDFAPFCSNSSTSWSCLKVVSTHAFDEVGIIAKVSSTLAKDNISILSVSSFNGDHFMVPDDAMIEAIEALRKNGYTFEV